MVTSYIYVLPQHPFARNSADFRYLSIHRLLRHQYEGAIDKGATVFLYYKSQNNKKEGLIGYCTVGDSVKQFDELPANEQTICFNKNLPQLPVFDIHCFDEPFIDNDVLFSLAEMNDYKLRPRSSCIIYAVSSSINSSIFSYSRYWYVWREKRSEREIAQHKQLFVHQIREKISYGKYWELSKIGNTCEHCGMEHRRFSSYHQRFFEYHITGISCLGSYPKIPLESYTRLCPSCHALAHEQMVSESYEIKHWIPIVMAFNSCYFQTEWEAEPQLPCEPLAQRS